MITPELTPEHYQEFQDNQLLNGYEDTKHTLMTVQERLNRLEQEIFRRIQERGGTSLPNADENGEQIWVCEQVDSYSYDHSRFTPLLEQFNSTEVDKCYVREHVEQTVIPGKWNTQQLKAVAKKHGAEAVALVESARVPTGRKLKFKRIYRDA